MESVLVSCVDRVGAALFAFLKWLDLDFYEVALIAGFALFLFVIYRLDHADSTEFNFEDLFTHGDRVGKADLFKLTAFGCFLAHSWVIIRSAAYDKLTESNLTWYAGIWSGAYVVLKGFQTFGGKWGGHALLPPDSPTPPEDGDGAKPKEGQQ